MIDREVNMSSNLSAVSTGIKKCKPFLLEVMISPPRQDGFKFELTVEKGCTPENDAIWKLVFDLFKQMNGEFVQVAHVSFKAGSQDEKKGIKDIAVNGITEKAAETATNEVLPKAKELASQGNSTPALNEELKKGMSRVAIAQLEGDA
jgi:hypothetical protein